MRRTLALRQLRWLPFVCELRPSESLAGCSTGSPPLVPQLTNIALMLQLPYHRAYHNKRPPSNPEPQQVATGKKTSLAQLGSAGCSSM